MSIVIHKNLSNEEYNSLLTASTLSELEAVRDLFLDSISSNEEKLNSSLVSIRCLSEEEYDKYITNGTCNGAINKYNENVWHDDNLNPQKFKAYVYTNELVSDYVQEFTKYPEFYADAKQYFINAINIIKPIYKDYNKWIQTYNSDAYRKVGTTNLTSYVCIFLNNSKEIHSSQNVECCCIAICRENSYGRVNFTYCSPVIKKSDSVKTHNFTITTSPKTQAWNASVTHNLNYTCYSCFRPVFQYKDNNKSKNIYY